MADVIAPGVWWLHGTRGSNVFAIDAGGQLLLIDTGFASSADAIITELAQIAPGRRLDAILLTHSHVDHAGAAAAL
ncbi:MAG: MBL fold metallo-hydrolase, partial [Chloroflexi bacterium]|nr:MBL fold metallo-hydrolase [Chloroflexota bacterium]